MASYYDLSKFDCIYYKTYFDLVKYVIIKCHNMNDTNDIIQETYLELWKILNKRELSDINIKSYLIAIANNKIKKHFTLIQKIKAISLFDSDDEGIELIDKIPDRININDLVINEDNWDIIWNFLKSKKNKDISKVFYLHYKLELSIKEISKNLNVTESYIKHLIYRTLNELEIHFGNGDY